jgi:NADPH:quinone reductase-like Zn-dependent oxidoreductase
MGYQRNQTPYGIFLTRKRQRLTEMTPIFERALARPCIGSALSLDQIVDVHQRLDTGHNKGKIVIEVT